ncbi:hypothetical protein PBCV1_a376R [Paramecium bursaria Chlorella virus 1]|uniref:Uncharacterized protein n=1 Tax=Paramecium bursaria Chlorella virus 1 TaxID=10506 RepID=Q98428_PBCV1|nr:hypothetical protein PBCV1_a376R [Paramecium bursaria Chlorella virus 1]AAC96744.2 hypothetical protein [Paramecium bursaria Chlorella virus 1]
MDVERQYGDVCNNNSGKHYEMKIHHHFLRSHEFHLFTHFVPFHSNPLLVSHTQSLPFHATPWE